MSTTNFVSRAISLKEVLVLMENAALSLGKLVQTALGLWLQIQEGLQQHQQHKHNPHAEAAVHAVQTALHAAQVCGTEEQRLVWMKQHVPGISAALTAHAVTQLDISLKRLHILRQLVANQAQPLSEQLSARLKTETDLYWRLSATGRIAAFFSPVATVLRALSGGWEVARNDASLHGQHGRRHALARSYQQGAELLKHMALQLMTENCHIMEHIEKIEQGLQGMGVSASSVGPSLKVVQVPGGEVGDVVQRSIFLQILATMTWLGIALLIPPTGKHHAAQAWLGIVDWWSVAIGVSIPYTQCVHPRLRDLLCRILARPDLCEYMTNDMLSFTCGMLHAYGVHAQQLQDAGVSNKVAQLLQPLLQQAALDYQSAKLSEVVVAANREEGSGDGDGSTAAPTTEKAPEIDFDLDDMQALVQLMYGTTDVKL